MRERIKQKYHGYPKSLKLTILYSIPFLTIFSLLFVSLLAWEMRSHRNEQMAEFVEAGRVFSNQILVEKIWSTKHKDVYIKTVGKSHASESFVQEHLSRVDYKSISAEMAEIAKKLGGHKFRIIDINNPSDYETDEWEEKGIVQIKRGIQENYGIEEINGKRYFRYMKPLSLRNDSFGDTIPANMNQAASISISTAFSDSVHRKKVRRILISFGMTGLISMVFIVILSLKLSRRVSSDIKKEVEQNKLDAAVELAGATAHEMRQPLTVVIGLSEIVSDKHSKGRNAHRELQVIKEESFRMNDIITKMLNITHYRTKKYSEGVEIFDLHYQQARPSLN